MISIVATTSISQSLPTVFNKELIMRKTILALALATLMPISAMAHSPLKSTSPQEEAELKSVPASITMVFGKPARLTKITLVHIDGDKNHSVKLEIPSKQFETRFELVPKFSGKGRYQVDWRALSKDGHPLKGSFSFKVTE